VKLLEERRSAQDPITRYLRAGNCSEDLDGPVHQNILLGYKSSKIAGSPHIPGFLWGIWTQSKSKIIRSGGKGVSLRDRGVSHRYLSGVSEKEAI